MAVPVLNGKTQFLDASGVALALGTVTLYVPGTTTAKQTWQDQAKSVLNTTPTITLDAGGYAMIYGAGAYRQIVKDALGNTIWDQVAWANDPTDAANTAVTAFAATLAASGGAGIVGLGTHTVADISTTAGAGIVGARTGSVQAAIDSAAANSAAGGQMLHKCSVLILGDSILEGTAASSYLNSYGTLFARSVMNANNQGYPVSAGYGYHSILNLQNAITEASATSTGTLSATGFLSSRLSLAAGQYIELTGRQIAYFDAIYDGALSTGSLLFKLNGATIATKAVSGAILNNTFPTLMKNGANTLATDTLRIEATGGTVVLTGILMLRAAQGVPVVFVAAKSGTAYQDYTSSASMDEVAYYLNSLGNGSATQIMIHALGTNNIYNAGKSLTPTAMIAQITTLIAGLNSRVGSNLMHIIQVPPKANEAIWPVIQGGYTYADYVTALVDYAALNHYGIVRQDLTPITTDTSLLSDGLHPTTRGHFVMGQTLTRSLGLPFNSEYTLLALETLRGSATYNPPSIASGASATTLVGCTGANMGDFAQASFSLNTLGLTVSANVTAGDNVTVVFTNNTGGAVDLGSGTVNVVVTRA